MSRSHDAGQRDSHRADSATHRRRRSGHRHPAPSLHSPPGTLEFDPHALPASIRVIRYSPTEFMEAPLEDASTLAEPLAHEGVTWVGVTGLGDAESLKAIAAAFGIHPLAMEDILDITQPAKLEPFENRVLLVLPRILDGPDGLRTEQLSMLVGPGLVVTFEESPGSDTLDRIRTRLREHRGRIRDLGAFFLAYAILDASIDSYFPILAEIGERLDRLEDEVVVAPRATQVGAIREIRRELMLLRRLVWPIRDLVAGTIGLEHLGRPEIRPYLRDALDHATRLMDLVEMDRVMASELMELHLAATSNRLGEINRFLTIVATIFIPLGTIAGIYGMNFDPQDSPFNMPELYWRYGYPFALALMAATALAFLAYFWRKGWLSQDPAPPRQRKAARSGR